MSRHCIDLTTPDWPNARNNDLLLEPMIELVELYSKPRLFKSPPTTMYFNIIIIYILFFIPHDVLFWKLKYGYLKMISKVITINLIKTCFQLLDLSIAVLLTLKIIKQTFTKTLYICRSRFKVCERTSCKLLSMSGTLSGREGLIALAVVRLYWKGLYQLNILLINNLY